MIQALILDFDGVVLESVEVKTLAFKALFSHEASSDVDCLLKYHQDNGGLSRYKKFQWFYSEILNRDLLEKECLSLGERFSKLVKEKMIECPFVPGAYELITRLSGDIPLFIASGTPQKELREIVDRRNLAPFFSGVYGSPASKANIIEYVLERNKIEKQLTLMVGDSTTDLEGARLAGVPFIGRLLDRSVNPFPKTIQTVPDLAELDHIWNTLP